MCILLVAPIVYRRLDRLECQFPQRDNSARGVSWQRHKKHFAPSPRLAVRCSRAYCSLIATWSFGGSSPTRIRPSGETRRSPASSAKVRTYAANVFASRRYQTKEAQQQCNSLRRVRAMVGTNCPPEEKASTFLLTSQLSNSGGFLLEVFSSPTSHGSEFGVSCRGASLPGHTGPRHASSFSRVFLNDSSCAVGRGQLYGAARSCCASKAR